MLGRVVLPDGTARHFVTRAAPSPRALRGCMVLITLRLSEPLDLIEVYFTFDTVSFYLFEDFFNDFATPSIEDRRTV